MPISNPVHWKEKYYDKGAKYDKIVEIITALNLLDNASISDGEYVGITITLTNGEVSSMNFGDFVYISSSGTMKLADATDTTTAPCIGMVVETIAASNSGKVLIYGFAYSSSWSWTIGAGINNTLYLSETAGDLTLLAPTTSGAAVQAVAVAYHTNKILVMPALTVVEVA